MQPYPFYLHTGDTERVLLQIILKSVLPLPCQDCPACQTCITIVGREGLLIPGVLQIWSQR